MSPRALVWLSPAVRATLLAALLLASPAPALPATPCTSDGSGLKRLTTMNLAGPGNREDGGRTLVAGKVTADPGGDVLLGDVQDSLLHQTGFVERIRLTCPP